MTPSQTRHTEPRPLLTPGAAALLTGGLFVLMASAAAGRLYWQAEPPRTTNAAPVQVPVETPVQAASIWTDALPTPAPVRFAVDGLAESPLPRATRAPASGPRVTAPSTRPAEGAQAPQVWLAALDPAARVRFADDSFAESPLLRAARPAGRATQGPQPEHGADTPIREGAPDAASRPVAPLVIASVPPVTPPPRPLRDRESLVASVTAAPLPDEPADRQPRTDSAETGLARSLLPRARPEGGVHLASLAAPAPELQTAPATREPVPEASVLTLPATAARTPERCDASHARAIPRRPSGAEGGQAAIARLAASAGGNRDNAIAQAITAGNIPPFLRILVPVTLTGTDAGGRATRITLCVMPDYLALGSDSDFVRVPLGLPAANRIAERFDMVLPTTRMVDAIHAQARVQLRPSPMTPGAQMASTDYFLRHNATLEGQRRNTGAPLGVLVSGHKKDLVLSNRLERNPGRVAIYGWHQASGQPIQPLSTVHGASYADYSHGIRLISRTAYVQGHPVDLRDLLADSRYAGLISNEGPISSRLMLAALR